MKKRSLITVTAIVAAIAAVGLISTAYADWGRGYGMGGWGHHGPGWHHRGWAEPGSGYGYGPGNISEEDLAKLNERREAFFKETEDTRRKLDAKQLELRSELTKEESDAQKAAALQKEISALNAELDQKRLEYMIQNKDLDPGYGPYGGKGRMGYGPRMGYGGCPGYGPGNWR